MVLPSKRLVESLQKRTEDAFYTDVATINYKTISGYDEYGQPTYTTNAVDVDCSFRDGVGNQRFSERWANYADIEEINAEIRFTGDKPSKGDTVTLKSMYNRDTYEEQGYADQEFEIVAIRDRDVFGYMCALKQVQV